MARDISWRVPKRRLFSTPVPAETRTYKPVSHKKLAKATLEAIHEAGFELGVEEYYSAKDGLVATARYTIKDIRDEDMQLEIGWQNSYDKTLSLKFAIGTRIFICENGCVSGNFGSFARKHMADIQEFAPEEMGKSIREAAKVFDIMCSDKDRMKATIVGTERQTEMVGKLFFVNDAIGSTQLNIINSELRKPTHDYKAPNSIWEIYQYTTFAMKELHPRLWMEAHIDVHKFFLNECDREEALITLSEDAGHWRELCEVSSRKGISTADLTAMITPRTSVIESDPAQVDLEDSINEIEKENGNN